MLGRRTEDHEERAPVGGARASESGADADEVAASIEAFIRVRSRVSADDRRFSRQSNLWEDGYVDSIGVVELIGHIESTFAVTIPDETLFDPSFTSVEGIARIVSSLTPERAA